jgi:hypothetical protein
MTAVVLIRVCTCGLACALWASAALGASGGNAAQAHCVAEREADARAAQAALASRPSDAHAASLLAVHELTLIEMGGSGLTPMRWGKSGAMRPCPDPIARGGGARFNFSSKRGCKS